MEIRIGILTPDLEQIHLGGVMAELCALRLLLFCDRKCMVC